MNRTTRRSFASVIVLVVIAALVTVICVGLPPSSSVSRVAPTAPVAAPSPGLPSADDAAADPDPTEREEFSVVDPELAQQVTAQDAPAAGVDAVFLADKNAQADPAFRSIAADLTKVGEGLYSGALTQPLLDLVANVPGLKVSANKPLSFGNPPAEPASGSEPGTTIEPADSPSVLLDAITTVPNIDPQLAATRAAQGIQGQGQVIAVLDTGIDTAALGLAGKVIHRESFAPANPACTGSLDEIGHGTHVSSIAAGAVNTVDPSVTGVAPQAKLVDLPIFNCLGFGSSLGMDQALSWVRDHRVQYGITVVNLSGGTISPSSSDSDTTCILVNQLVAAGVVVVISAGNQGDGAATLTSPGTAEFATTIGSASTSANGQALSPFSGQGPILGRPGVDFLGVGSSVRAANTTSIPSQGTSVIYSGTSMSTPYVAGLAALLRQKFPSLMPNGSICSVGPGCEVGVVPVTMVNPIQSKIAASDWFAPGVDSISGAGLVSASKSLLGTVPAPAPSITAPFSTVTPNLIRVPPHTSPVTITVMLSHAIRDSAFDALHTIEYAAVNTQGVTSPAFRTCSNHLIQCSYDWTWTPRSWAFISPANPATSWIRMSTNRDVTAEIIAPGFGGSLSVENRVRVDDAQLDSSGVGELEVSSAFALAAPLTIDLVATAGLTVPAQVVLPAGPAGTSATIPVSQPNGYVVPAHESSARVTMTVAGDLVALASVQRSLAPGVEGRLTVDGKQVLAYGIFDSGLILSADGSIVGASNYPTLASIPPSLNGFAAGAIVVPAGSNDAQRVDVLQPQASSVSVYGADEDNSRLLDYEYSWAEDRWFYNIFDRENGDRHEIATEAMNADGSRTDTPVLSTDGSAAGFILHPTNNADSVLYWQGGADYADFVPLGTFDPSSNVRIIGITDSGVIVTVNGLPNYDTQVRIYPINGDPFVAPLTVGNGYVALSADKQSLAYADLTNQALGCVRFSDSSVVSFPSGAASGNFYWPGGGFLLPANNCASLMVSLWMVTESPDPWAGQLVRLWPGGAKDVLARSFPDRDAFHWMSDPTGTHFLTITSNPVDPGDTNGLGDIYRGLISSPEGSFSTTPAPTVSGTKSVGSTLTAVTGVWTPQPTSFGYQWSRNGVPIPGATSASYALVSADAGFSITVSVTANRVNYAPVELTSSATSLITGLSLTTSTPTISGAAAVDSTLTATAPWGPGTVTKIYVWKRDGVAIAGATSATYIVTASDADATVSVQVTGTKAGYTTVTMTSPGLKIAKMLTAMPVPTVTGLPHVGETLAASIGVWGPSPVTLSLQWKRDGIAVAGATSSTYSIRPIDLGTTITAVVVGSKPGYASITRTSVPLVVVPVGSVPAMPSISGTPAVGSLLTVVYTVPQPGYVTLHYWWKRNGQIIPGATANTYLLSASDSGATISVTITGTKNPARWMTSFGVAVP